MDKKAKNKVTKDSAADKPVNTPEFGGQNNNPESINTPEKTDSGVIEDFAAAGGADVPPIAKATEKEKSILSIGAKSFISVVVILLALIIATGITTFFVPRGIITDGVYVGLGVKGYPVWRWFTAPFEVLASKDGIAVIMVSLFIVVLGGCFNVMDKTGGIRVIIQSLIKKFQTKKYLLMCLIILMFMVLGAFFGIFEESVALLPIIIMLAISLGWDTFTGMAMCLIASGFGFASAITNPFSVGLASSTAGISILDGLWLRALIFIIMYALLCGFVYLYIRRLEKHPEKSPTYESDKLKRDKYAETAVAGDNDKKTLKVYIIFFISLFSILIVSTITGMFVSAIQDISMVIIMVTFLAGTLIAASFIEKFKKVLIAFGKGALSIAPAVLLIMLAGSIKFIMTSSQIEGTMLHSISSAMSGMHPMWAAIILFFFILFLNFLIGSSSAKVILIMPIIIPICKLVGIPYTVAVLSFVLADGYSNVIFPTNPVLLLGLSVSEFSYGQWVKKTGLLQLIALVFCVLFIMLASAVF